MSQPASSDTTRATGSEPRSRTGYRAVAAGFVGNMTSVGLTLYLFGVVLDDMRETFGVVEEPRPR